MPKYVNKNKKKNAEVHFFEQNIDKPMHSTFSRFVCTEVLETKFTL